MATKGPDPTVSDRELIDAIAKAAEPFATAGGVAERVGLSDWRVRQRLERLGERGELNRARVGGGPWIYWLDDSFSSGSS
ncbi:hypothetical protein EAF64_17950 [Halorientalis pallida]|uniref:HTH domain-containing protein n=1 Tax=Halorientalis pallida TaxID=2479928 RepID=A0A498KS06_9EURY|nr:hypothetical protein EAF64_17950 [Halorientalis pallida]